jgi:mono/diheme cytochrome c family protein
VGRRFKWIAWSVIAVGVALTVGVVALLLMGLPRYDVPAVVLPVDDTPQVRERGRALVFELCWRCHYDGATGALTGRPMPQIPAEMGTIGAPNITQHEVDGIGGWTAGELAYLLRTGVNPKSTRIVPPWMPRWPQIADEDAAAIAVFLLEADHAWVAPRAGGPAPSRHSPYVNWLARTQWDPIPYPMLPMPRPPQSDPIAHGRYLVEHLLQCGACHRDEAEGEGVPITTGTLAGGRRLVDAAGQPVIARNLTPDATGLAAWSVDDLRRALVEGVRPDGAWIAWPMPRYAHLSEAQSEAIFAYLRTLAPVARTIEPASRRVIGPKADLGRHVYEREGCPACHDHDGEGIASLLGLERDDDAVVRFIAGPSGDAAGIMPAFADRITEAEYVALVAYLRRLVSPE